MILEWHLFLRLSLGFDGKCLVLWENVTVFTQKMSVHFQCFLFKWIKELNQQVCLIKYVENKIQTLEKKQRERSKTIIQLQKH